MTNDKLPPDDNKRSDCDAVVEHAVRLMVIKVGASVEMACDRMLTYVGAQSVSMDGSAHAAAVFRALASKIEAGTFKHLDPDRPARNN